MWRGRLIRRVSRREHICGSLECIISGFELVDGDWFNDRRRQGIPLADHSVCEVLTGESSSVPSDSIGCAEMTEWARLDHRVHPTDVGRGWKISPLQQVDPRSSSSSVSWRVWWPFSGQPLVFWDPSCLSVTRLGQRIHSRWGRTKAQ